VATAVCDRALLIASIWLSTGQSQEHSGTVAATGETDFKALKQLQCYQCVEPQVLPMF
jgi:hypothetical protein